MLIRYKYVNNPLGAGEGVIDRNHYIMVYCLHRNTPA